MKKERLEKKIAEEIIQLSAISVKFLEKEFKEPTPAGKFQVYALTSAIVFELLKKTNLFNQINGLNIHHIIKNIQETYLKYAKKYKEELYLSWRAPFKFDNDYLDELQAISKNILITFDKNSLDNSLEIGIYHLWKELSEYLKSFEQLEKNQGDIIFPKYIFITLYAHPFFLTLISDNNKYEVANRVLIEVDKNNKIRRRDFLGIPALLFNHISQEFRESLLFKWDIKKELSYINYDMNRLKRIEMEKKQEKCYVATLVYDDIKHPKVIYLRNIRDRHLKNHYMGRVFINAYYKYAPAIVNILKPYKILNSIIRKNLDFLIYVLQNILKK